jgi:EAL domain-containing protein (putative c-di-GMP-specific phosphodiesterase class I)
MRRLEASFRRALDSLWIAYQPIVCAQSSTVFGYEALLRSTEPSLPHPGAVLDAAERLGQLDVLGRIIRDRAAEPITAQPESRTLFVNLHTDDLLDPTLLSPDAPLSRIAKRVVLEITERASLDRVKDLRSRIAELREMGFRVAVDDLGAGYAGLTSFALLEPEIVKLDMTLVRDVHLSATKQKLIRSMTALCKDMGMLVVGEDIETAEERDTLISLGCDLLQGYLFAKPGKPFPEVSW